MKVVIVLRSIAEHFDTVPEFLTLEQLLTTLGFQVSDRPAQRTVREWMSRQGWEPTVRRVDGRNVRGYAQSPKQAVRFAFTAPPVLVDAARDVLAERQRQISAEGWTPEHDDGHVNDEIAAMACFYAMPPGAREWSAENTGYGDTFGEAIIPEGWAAKVGDRRRELVKAGALILAEIERLDRSSVSATAGTPTGGTAC